MMQLTEEHLPEVAIHIKKTRSLPKIDFTHKFGDFKARFLISFDQFYNPDETLWFLQSCQKFLHEIIEPQQLLLPFKPKYSVFSERSTFLKERIKDKTFLDVSKFQKYSVELLKEMLVKLVEENREVMVSPSMTFVFKIYGTEREKMAANALARIELSQSPTLKVTHIGSFRLFLNIFFAENLWTPADLEFIYRALKYF